MSGPVSRKQEQNQTAQLAEQFNRFYLDITSPQVSQIGNYSIIKEIGEGAFGKVYLAQHLLLDTQVVLKCGLLDDPNIVREIYYHRQLRHKNVVKLYEVIRTESHLWMVLEYCEGNELYHYIYEQRRLGIEVCRHLFYQIVDAIRYVHLLNLSHRDLKLENILLADKRRTVVKLTDFGFVREFNPYKRTLLSTVCGTTAYMAPEVLLHHKYSGFAGDIWLMGIILYAMVYGELPFDEDDDLKTKYRIVNEEPMFRELAPPEVILLLRKMLAKDPTARPLLPEILNLAFLIDLTNNRTVINRSSAFNDTESIMSINQHYKMNAMPFQAKIERHLLKKMEKLNVDVDAVQAAVFAGQANPLTAFYELALALEYKKKRTRYLKKKRYYEAKRQLKKSRKRVKSVLLLLDQATAAPLEKIILSLSLSSRQDLAPRPDTSGRQDLSARLVRRSTERARTPLRQLSGQSSRPASVSHPAPPGLPDSSYPAPEPLVSVPLERQVSFFPDDRSAFSVESPRRGKKILGRLQFWKRNKDDDDDSRISRQPTTSTKSSGESALVISVPKKPLPEYPQPEFLRQEYLQQPEHPSHETLNVPTIPESTANSSPGSTPLQDSPRGYHRPRPESMVSQMSAYSQLSHLYALSELEVDLLDATDDEYFDDISESSINTLQHDLSHRPLVMQPSSSTSTSRKLKRPPSTRMPSDTLILSGTRMKKSLISQVLSNSSDDGSTLLRLTDRFYDDVVRPPLPQGLLRQGRAGVSPKTSFRKVQNPAPLYPQQPSVMPKTGFGTMAKFNGAGRPSSPPVTKSFAKLIKSDTPAINGNNAFKWPEPALYDTLLMDTPVWEAPAEPKFERKFIKIEEEEEEEE